MLRALRPDVLVVAAYGLLLPQKVLDIPEYFSLNVHGSLLPQYRGAATIQRAVMNGDAMTGVTIMKMEAGLDTGPMLLQQAVRIEPEDTSGSMFTVLAEHGANLMLGALRMVSEGRTAFIPQNDSCATYAHKIGREEELIDWSRPSQDIHNIIRGLTPDPGARTFLHVQGKEPLGLRIGPGEAFDFDAGSAPGTLVRMEDGGLLVACGSGSYKITSLRPAGKKTMNAADFYNGRLKGMSAPYGVLSRQPA
jgi:methionyl-tRNA formyltransferase